MRRLAMSNCTRYADFLHRCRNSTGRFVRILRRSPGQTGAKLGYVISIPGRRF